MYVKKEKIYPDSVSKHNSDSEKQVILIMIPNSEWQWYYLSVKKLLVLLRGLSKNNGDFYCLNCLYSFKIKKTCIA